MTADPRAYANTQATTDVTRTLQWLEVNDFRLRRAHGGPGESFGNVLLEYERSGTSIVVVRDRGQWLLDVSPSPREPPMEYGILVAAAEGRDFRDYAHTPGALPEQLPEGVVWHQTLPKVLDWLAGPDTREAIAEAADQKWVHMWPDSRKARDIQRRWRRNART
jgi:hypothetical protein